MHSLSPSLWAEYEERITEEGLVTPDMMYWIESWKPGERAMFLTVRTRPIRTKDGIDVFYAGVDVSVNGQLKARSKDGVALVLGKIDGFGDKE